MGSGLAAVLVVGLAGCDWMKKPDAPAAKTEKELAAERNERIRKACASAGTYERLKELVFDEAARIRNADARNLDPLAAGSVVRMEQPLVKSRDEDLNVTVCTGNFILELPPGAENAFDGMRRVSAEVEYSAQAAADGSGMVYQMDGAEPIIYRLATFGLNGQPMPRIVAAEPAEAPTQVAAAEPPAMPAPAPAPAPTPKSEPIAPAPKAKAPQPAPASPRQASSPSFACRYAKTSSEKRVCGSAGLASKDRQMASIYYAAMARADPGTRQHLRRSRDAFLARRERCGSDDCVTAAYNARIAEIRRIASGG
jgi:uncharacterized protein YecT (DUF1311 family)